MKHKPWGLQKATPRQKKLLEYMAESDPTERESVEEMCRKCGVSKGVYYRLFDSDNCAELIHDTSRKIMRRSMVRVVKKVCDQAEEGGAKQQEMVLKAGGVLPTAVPNEVKILNVFPSGSEGGEPLPGNEEIKRMIGWKK